ncbi:hypothetical protein CROQUDRAFT_51618 [Cronartium quercuum f. sp. fusiforme G11]|uniref:DUF7872 domain-containing protein n=1 Tax=Cronartium quercuum f. sp. fusiforme G11 TaxID=708437 RepID=A0A9P6T8H2_9BASI|nr:hypothetical protein CROQUDRAFT_51618 [Cronartium quercuum f. sp. fusiforme G11]
MRRTYSQVCNVKPACTCIILFLSLSTLAQQPISPVPLSSLQKRSSNFLFSHEPSDSNPNQDPCQPFEISPQTWTDMNIDEYLQKYPNADKITLQDFAREQNMPNFNCGIGMQCLAGQLCHPAQGINWLILYAAQQWNNFMNSLYKAIENAIQIVRDTGSSIVADFTPNEPIDKSLWWWSLGNVLCGVVGTFTALAVPAFLPADAIMVSAALASAPPAIANQPLERTEEELRRGDNKKSIEEEGKVAYETAKKAAKNRNLRELEKQKASEDVRAIKHFFLDDSYKSNPTAVHYQPPPRVAGEIQRVFSTEDPILGGVVHDVPHPPPTSPVRSTGLERRSKLWKRNRPSSYTFTRYTHIEPHLNSLQNRIQGFVALTLKLGTMAPILADGGIASILSQGSYLIPNPTENKLQEGGRKLAEILILGQFFRSVNYFVTIGSDPCKFKGPNGAKDKPDELSYCTPDGLMMNIIRANQDKAINQIPHGHLLKEKYGYSVEFLAKSAWKCQKKYGLFTTAR